MVLRPTCLWPELKKDHEQHIYLQVQVKTSIGWTTQHIHFAADLPSTKTKTVQHSKVQGLRCQIQAVLLVYCAAANYKKPSTNSSIQSKVALPSVVNTDKQFIYWSPIYFSSFLKKEFYIFPIPSLAFYQCTNIVIEQTININQTTQFRHQA